MSGRIDFTGIAAALLASFGYVCGHLLPGGRYVGNEYQAARRANGGLGDSLSVNKRTGVWLHGASGASGGDLISLWAHVHGYSGAGAQLKAAQEARAWLGLPDDERDPPVSTLPPARIAEGPTPEQVEKRRRAEAIWRATRPFRGSKAETYLRGRGLWEPPDCVSLRYSPDAWHSPGNKFPAMIAAVLDCDGAFLGVHQTFVARDGRKKAAVDPAKKMLGPIRGGAVRLGPMGRKIAVTEGIETGLAVANATGLTVWAALSAGGIAALELPAGVEEVVICADNDAPGVDAANRAAARWCAQGIVVRVIVPPLVGSDFADLLVSNGADTVSAVISAAPIWMPEPPVALRPSSGGRYLQASAPTYSDNGTHLEAARAVASESVRAFFSRATSWGHNGPPDIRCGNLIPSDQIDAPALALRVGVGIGKTECAVRGLTHPDYIAWNVAYFVPTNELAGEIAKRGNAQSAKLTAETGKAHPAWKHWKGRGQEHVPGVPMCARYDAAKLLEAVGVSVARTLCHRRVDTGRPRLDDPSKTIWIDKFCPHHPDAGGDCPYIRQARDTEPAIRVAASALAFIENSGLPASSLTVFDESFWRASIEGLGDAAQKLFVPLQAIDHERPTRAPFDAQNEADTARIRLLAAIEGARELTVAALAKAGLTHELCGRAADAWKANLEAAPIFPDDDNETVAAKTDTYEASRGFTARKMLRMWSLLRDELAEVSREGLPRDDIRSVRLGRARKSKGAEQGGAGLYLAWSRDLQPEISRNPVLICDATLEPDILNRFFPYGIQVREIEAAWPHVEVIQVPDAPTAKTKLTPRKSAGAKDRAAAERRIGEMRAILDLIGARIPEGGPRGLFVSNKKVVEAIQAHGGRGPVRNMDALHFNALAGKDGWRDVRDLVLIGAPVPKMQDLQDTARAQFWRDSRSIQWLPDGRLPDEARAVRMRDGSAPIIRNACHPDPLVNAVLTAIRDGELIQAIGRARPASRTAATPLRVTVLGGVVLPMTVDRLVPWDEARPGPIEAALARSLEGRGVLPLAAPWLHTAMPDLFPSLRTAEREAGGAVGKDRQSSYRLSIGELAVLAEYRVGKSKSWSRALIRTGHPDPEDALAEALGTPLAAFRWVDAGPPSGAVPALPRPTAKPPDAAGDAPGARSLLNGLLDGDAPRGAPVGLCGCLAADAAPTAAPAEVVARIGTAQVEAWFTADGALVHAECRRDGARGANFDGRIWDQFKGADMGEGIHDDLPDGKAWCDAELAKLHDARRVLEGAGIPAAERILAAAFVLRAAGLLPPDVSATTAP